jgi:hypothetical protein
MGVGALVLSYYLTYFAGVRWRLSSSQASPGRLTKLGKILLLGCCLMASACALKEDFPTENQMKARLNVGMTVREVLPSF